VRPQDVPFDLLAVADLAMSDMCAAGDAIDDDGPECTCPTDDQMKAIIAAALTELSEQIEEETADVDTISVRHLLGRLKGGKA
jgi:hypothetical protein